MKLLVAEKPSVANQHYRKMLERIAGEKFQQHDGFLRGKEYCITWAVGHLVTLAPFDQYEGYQGLWKLNNLPHLPQKFMLMPIEQTKKQLNIVRNLMAEADVLINGADAGREGNLIFDLIIDYSPELREKEIKRLWVNSYVAKELDAAWKKLENAEVRQNLSYAARLRQRADWMVGLNATRGYTLTAGHGKLISVGRVQTPTLNLIVERDFQVENFQEFFSYGLVGEWRETKALWYREDKVAFFEENKIPLAVKAKCETEKASIVDLDTTTKKKFPLKPFDLTELQKEANKKFKFKVQKVLDIAQNLYEKKFVTYPRTDSQYLNDGMKSEAYQLLMQMASEKQKQLLRPQSENFVFINSKKVSDHYAIIPTGEAPHGLNDDEMKVYKLIVKRFIHAWMEPYIWEEYQAKLSCQNEEFRTKLKKVVQKGFTALQKEKKPLTSPSDGTEGTAPEETSEKNTSKNKDDNSDDLSVFVEEFPNWSMGDSELFSSLELRKKKKSKPKYYTEATLLTAMKTAGKNIDDEDLAEAMKDRGLGTPATQAGIIETLKKRGFVEAQKNNIVSTDSGKQVISYMDERIKSPEMTGEWEYKLSQIEKGQYNPADFRDEIKDYVKTLFESLHKKYENEFTRENVSEKLNCPKCSKEIDMRPWGYICGDPKDTNSQGCGFSFNHTIAQRSLSHEEVKNLFAEKKSPLMEGFISKKGKEFSAMLKFNDEFEVEFDFESADKNAKILEHKCPKCSGELKDFTNRVSCINEKCDFVIWKTMAGVQLEESDIEELLTTQKTGLKKGFISKKNKSFSAHVILDDEFKTAFEFDNDGSFGGEETDKICPHCQANLKENAKTLFCNNDNCKFIIFKNMAGVKIKAEHIKQLLNDKKTDEISGFKSKKGNTFNAALKVEDDGRVSFHFENNNSSGQYNSNNNSNFSPSASPYIASLFSEKCIKCGSAMNYNNSWIYCSESSCGFSLPRMLSNRALDDDTLKELMKSKKTAVLEGFSKNDKKFKAALILNEQFQVKFDPSSVELI